MPTYDGQFDNGTITVTVTEGTAPYEYIVYETDDSQNPTTIVATNANGDPASSIQLAQTHTFNNMPPGPYYVEVTDNESCVVTGQVVVDSWPCTGFGITTTILQNETEFEAEDGRISYTVTEGENWDGTTTTSTYTITISQGSTIIATSSDLSGIFGDLAPGSYTITATETGSGSNCIASTTRTITAADEIINRTFYWFHGGSTDYLNEPNSVIGTDRWTETSATFAIDGDTVNTVDFQTAISTLLQRYDDGVTLPYTIGSADLPESLIIGDVGGDFSMGMSATDSYEYYYFIVPNNGDPDYDVDFTQSALVYSSANPGAAVAPERRAFTYNGEDYWLHRIYAASPAALTLYLV